MGFEPTFSCLEGKGTTFIPTPHELVRAKRFELLHVGRFKCPAFACYATLAMNWSGYSDLN